MISIIIAITLFLGLLMLLALPHELGHFLAAKRYGVRVDEFGLGLPPRLLAIKRGETVYSLNAIPLGGFVKVAGELDPSVPNGLASKSTGVRFVVLVIGSVINALIAVLLLAIPLMFTHEIIVEKILVRDTLPDSPAALAGIKAGDQITVVDWQVVHNVHDLRSRIYVNLGREINVRVVHPDSSTAEFQITPRWIVSGGENATGLVVFGSNSQSVNHRYPFWQAIPLAFTAVVDMFVIFKNVLISMVLGITPVVLMGPIGLTHFINELLKSGLSYIFLLNFTAFLSANLALINLFPFPGLDGGRIAFVLLEWFRRGRRVPPKTEGLIHGVGFALIIILVIFIAYQDILRIIHGSQFLK
jgi:regulator of sigma E protease